MIYGVGVLSLGYDDSAKSGTIVWARWWNFVCGTVFCCVNLFISTAISMQFVFRYYALCRCVSVLLQI